MFKHHWVKTAFLIIVLQTQVVYGMVQSAPPSQGIGWGLQGIVLVDDGSAYALFITGGSNASEKWVKAGDYLGQYLIHRIEKNRVVVLDGELEILLYPGDGITRPAAPRSPPPVSAPPAPQLERPSPPPAKKDVPIDKVVQLSRPLQEISSEQFEQNFQSPAALSSKDRQKAVSEITRAYQEGAMSPFFTQLVNEESKEVVSGVKAASAIKVLGLQKGDFIFHINGITLDSEERWHDVLEVIQGSEIVSVGFMRGDEVHLNVFKVE